MSRPGRKPVNHPERVAGLTFANAAEADEVRARGGGPWIIAQVREALGHQPAEHPIETRVIPNGENIELRTVVPRSRLKG